VIYNFLINIFKLLTQIMGHGFKMAPVIGKILTELVVDGETNEVDLKHFSIGRFNNTSKH
jgi:glycine/D-amino acid oxidase-like deaminating enzyme